MLAKTEILSVVSALGDRIGKEALSTLFQEDKSQSTQKIGHGQFRELAVLCGAAECPEEIELLVRYNTAKASANQSWAKKCGGRTFGALVLGCMEEIRGLEQDSNDLLTDLMHFFGYLYWQSRIWTAENPAAPGDDRQGNHGSRTERRA